MNRIKSWALPGVAAVAVATLVACGGGSEGNATGTMRLSLTDAAACGYDHVYVTVEKVRVHQSGSAGDNDAGWHEVVLPTPIRADLLELTNGSLLPLGQTELPAGTYTQMRLVLASNTSTDPLANAIQPTGGTLRALTTPSGQQSGLKANINLTVPAGQVADFAIDFDACKSFVRAGNSGQYLIKPVLTVIPILTTAGQRIVGFVDPALANTSTSVSAQAAGVPVRATPPDATGRFTLYPVPAGFYDLVVTAPGRVNAVMTAVPVTTDTTTVIGSTALRISPLASTDSAVVSGSVTPSADADVRALQTLTGGTKVEVAYSGADSTTGAYSMTLPRGALHAVPYVAGATTFTFTPDPATVDTYTIEARSGSATKATDPPIVLPLAGPLNFVIP